MSTITLHVQNHGVYSADTATVERALKATANRSLHLIRKQAAGCNGFSETTDPFGTTPYDDCTWLEVIIMWVDGGNHTF